LRDVRSPRGRERGSLADGSAPQASLYTVKSIIVLDSEGGRIAAKYYTQVPPPPSPPPTIPPISISTVGIVVFMSRALLSAAICDRDQYDIDDLHVTATLHPYATLFSLA